MNTTPSQSDSQYTNTLLNAAHARATEPQIAPLTVDDITGDIERLISKIIAPYIDPTSFALNVEDLRGECRAKLARIISGGHLAKCPTRAKAFGFIKVAFRNHVLSLVQKNAYSMKRTGHKPHSRNGVGSVRKPCHIRIDDPEMDFQLGREDDLVRQREFLEELSCRLSSSEIIMLSDLTSKDAKAPSDAIELGTDKQRGRPHVPESVRMARARLYRKCRAILVDCD